MLKLEFTTEDVKALKEQRFSHPHPRVQKKMEAVYLKSQNLSHNQICQLVGISRTTLLSYMKQYEAGGIEQLKKVNFRSPQSELQNHKTQLEDYFKEHPFTSINQACSIIAGQTGITRSPTQVAKFLKELGIKRRKVGQIPAKADVEKQAEFMENELNPRIQEAQAGQRQLYFMDAAHFVLSPFLGFVYSFARLFIQSPSGRQRFNVLGAINAITKEILTVTNQSYITAIEVSALLTKIAAASNGLPITVVLDNARYQHCRFVKAVAERLQIELLFLPPYSPNLNLIERLWKFVKKKCLYSKYYDKFDKFKAAISDCLETAPERHKEVLDKLLTLKFQTFENVQFVTV